MPNTVNIGLNIANTGDFPGAWATTVTNADFQVIDGILGGNQTINLAGSTLTTLSIATGVIGTGSLTPAAGPTQSGNAIIQFSGALSGNCVVTFPRPGFWIVKNACTVGAFYVQARAAGTGNVIGLPPGAATRIWCDGVNMDYEGLGLTGSPLDLCVATTPAWMTACTILPFLPCLGTATYSASIYPALAVMLGSTYGGNGVTTFAAPDLGNRLRVSLGGGRLTSANSGIDGATLGASGGDERPQAHTHVASVTDPTHVHSSSFSVFSNSGTGNHALNANSGGPTGAEAPSIGASSTGISVANATSGAGSSGNVQPTVVFGMTFIKT